jgi:hypothetical protein
VAEPELPSVLTIFAGNETPAVGSGEIVRPDGYILTNDQVILPAVDGEHFGLCSPTEARQRRRSPDATRD